MSYIVIFKTKPQLYAVVGILLRKVNNIGLNEVLHVHEQNGSNFQADT